MDDCFTHTKAIYFVTLRGGKIYISEQENCKASSLPPCCISSVHRFRQMSFRHLLDRSSH